MLNPGAKARACRGNRELEDAARGGVGRGMGEPDRTKQLHLRWSRGEGV